MDQTVQIADTPEFAALNIGNTPVKASIDAAGNIVCESIDTGHGVNEVYAMDQDVKTTDSPTFA